MEFVVYYTSRLLVVLDKIQLLVLVQLVVLASFVLLYSLVFLELLISKFDVLALLVCLVCVGWCSLLGFEKYFLLAYWGVCFLPQAWITVLPIAFVFLLLFQLFLPDIPNIFSFFLPVPSFCFQIVLFVVDSLFLPVETRALQIVVDSLEFLLLTLPDLARPVSHLEVIVIHVLISF